MKGVVFNIFEDFVSENYGEDAYEQVLESTALETKDPFVGPGTYPDSDFIGLMTSACEVLDVSAKDAQRAFGKYCFPRLAELGSVFLVGHEHPRSFLCSVHDVIHVEVRKLYEHANPPEFFFHDEPDGSLRMRYRSERMLCTFMEGLVDGLADLFASPITLSKSCCMHDGSDYCEYNVRFSDTATPPQ